MNSETSVLIPNKDDMQKLTQHAKEVMALLNGKNSVPAVVPVFPLWLFNFHAESQNVRSITVKELIFNDREFYFPVEIIFKDDRRSEERITAGTVKNYSPENKKKAPAEDAFILKIKSFQTAEVSQLNNQLETFNAVWHKIT